MGAREAGNSLEGGKSPQIPRFLGQGISGGIDRFLVRCSYGLVLA